MKTLHRCELSNTQAFTLPQSGPRSAWPGRLNLNIDPGASQGFALECYVRSAAPDACTRPRPTCAPGRASRVHWAAPDACTGLRVMRVLRCGFAARCEAGLCPAVRLRGTI